MLEKEVLCIEIQSKTDLSLHVSKMQITQDKINKLG